MPVASIKRNSALNNDLKLKHAINGDNGLWLCNNHHKLFDINLLYISKDGKISYKTDIEQSHEDFVINFIANKQLPKEILTPEFISYLEKKK
ncbi:HNH endonuclease [Algoriphagus boritolerans]|uniref:HNH endonuclease n=1 Tax=Algoriphagus boritolerans TaxID=308111 RepID=UPI000B213E9D